MSGQQPIIIGMLDGLSTEYLAQSEMPNLKRMMEEGFQKEVSAIFPSVTNVNNVSICCGCFPSEHGITGNSYFNPETGGPEYMNSASMIKADSIFKRAGRHAVKSALLTSKRKTTELLAADCEFSVAAERAPQELIDRFGEPADIYSREINYWLWTVAIDLLENRPDIGVIYVHTTDYPMHTWAEDADESKEHLLMMDRLIGKAQAASPEAAFFFTADHGMNAKVRNWDLMKVCEEAGLPIRFSLSPERDYYIKHHKNYAGCAFVWLNDPADYDGVAKIVLGLEGVESIQTAAEAAAQFHSIPERLGDMVVHCDKETTIGDTDTAFEDLGPHYRNHGSLYEMDVPLAIWNFKGDLPPAHTFTHNKDLTSFLFAD